MTNLFPVNLFSANLFPANFVYKTSRDFHPPIACSCLTSTMPCTRTETSFHKACQEGRVGDVLDLLSRSPALVNTPLATSSHATPLMLAAASKNVATVELLFAQNADPSATDDQNRTALHYACKAGDFYTASYLIHVAEVNAQHVSLSGKTGLHHAAKFGNYSLMTLLINAGCRVHDAAGYGRTPMMIAASYPGKRNAPAVQALLDYCASVNEADNGGATALHFACQSNHYGATEKLIAAGADVDAACHMGRTPLFEAAKFADIKIVDLLLQSHCDLTARMHGGKSVLEDMAMELKTNFVHMLRVYDRRGVPVEDERVLPVACEYGHVAAVQALLQRASVQGRQELVHVHGSKALFKACREGHMNVVKVLLSWGVDARQGTIYEDPLKEALYRHDTHPGMLRLLLRAGAEATGVVLMKCFEISYWTEEGAEMLLEFGANVNAIVSHSGLALLSWAVREDNCRAVQFLLKHGADVHARDSALGFTPLHFVKWRASPEKIVQALLDAKADVNATCKVSATPLLYAVCRNSSVRVLDQLVKHGADLTRGDPAAEAARRGNLEILEFLLDARANVEVRSQYSKSALHLAVYNNHRDVVLKLLERGAGINVQNYSPSNDYRGGTPLMSAAARGNCAMVHTLLAQGADVFVRDRDGESVLEIVQRYGDGVNGNGLADVRAALFRAECEAKMVAVMMGVDLAQGGASWVRSLGEDLWKVVWEKIFVE